MNKKTVILLVILILLVIMTLCRWDTKWENHFVGRNSYYINLQVDRLTSSFKIVRYSKELTNVETGEMTEKKFTVYHNKYLIHGTTALLYSAMTITIIALLLEARKKE